LQLQLHRRAQRRPPDDARAVLASSVAEWPYLREDERDRVEESTVELLATKHWEAARGFELTDEMCTVIAAQGALMALGLDELGGVGAFRHVKAIVVHPGTITLNGPAARSDGLMSDAPRHLAGEAHSAHGPVLLAWDAVRYETRHPRRRRNVVIHELAHKLDMLGGVLDGAPPLADAEAIERWVEIGTTTWRAVKWRGDALLDDYAATDAIEFFAVASELFFTDPGAMAVVHADLYAAYRDFYGVDPAARRASPS
jgi:Mlc titration factor MtfA (ptsG expression regulator)